ncbi:MAG: hydroxymethylglutaryl-CoA lyase [Myxococcaceae bacterium]
MSSGLFDGIPKQVSVYEVGPRDGLQNELRTLSVDEKLKLITALADAGEKRIEVSSFVSPKWIPQLADADKVLERLPRRAGVKYSALVPNLKGLERAIAAKVDEVCVFLSVTEGHSKKNINKSVAEAIETVSEVTQASRAAKLPVRAYLSCVFGCPFDGAVSTGQVVKVLEKLATLDVYEFSLGDTIGVGVPKQVEDITLASAQVIGLKRIALHFHDTRGAALANAMVGLKLGVTTFDSSIGGLGGCPYAPGAAGNLATEDLVHLLHGVGVETGLSMDKLVEAGSLAQQLIGRKLSGKYLQAALGERERRH